MSSDALPRTAVAPVPGDRPAASTIVGKRDWRRPGARVALYLILLIGGLMMVFPFVWMVVSSLKSASEIYSLSLVPPNPSLANYREVLNETPFIRWFANSLLVAGITTASVAFFDSLVGYVLAKFRFPGRTLIFLVILSTLMVPTEMLVIPWYVLSIEMGWTDSYWGIMFPGVISAFGIFLMRQTFVKMPRDLYDAARLDGCGHARYFAGIVVPNCLAAFASLGLLTFLSSWNAYLWPLLVTNRTEMRTVQVGIRYFMDSDQGNQWGALMAASTLVVVPTLIAFLIAQRLLVEGFASAGIKG